MKIYLVTMKNLPNDYISQRMRYMAAEAKWEREHGGMAHPPAPVMSNDDPQTPPTPPFGPPVRDSSWIQKDKDEIALLNWRVALQNRIELLLKIGITIQPGKTQVDEDAADFEYRKWAHMDTPTFACVGEQLLQIMEVDDSVTVKSAAPVAADTYEGLVERLEKVIQKMESIDIPDPAAPPEHIYNQHCEVHLPGNLLATYNETLLLEDSCTDALQSALAEGWRIMAVCPQSQRRPDYIMGRFNPTMDLGVSAKRHA